MKGIAKTQRDLRIIRLYYEEFKTPAQIARTMKVSRFEVLTTISTANRSVIQTIAKAQISGIIRDSIDALASLAEEIKDQAEKAASQPISPTSEAEMARDRHMQAKRRTSVEMYRHMYDCVAPLIQEVVRRENPVANSTTPALSAAPVPPTTPEDTSGQIN